MATYSEQSNQGMTNFLNSTENLRKSFAGNQSTAQSTPAYSPKLNLTTKYPNLKNLGTITTNYGDSTHYEKFHPGIDIANKIGTPINAFEGGTVERVDTGKVQGDKGFGNRVIVKDAQGNEWSYGHNNNVFVKPGDTIKKGQEISTMGNTGSTYSTNGGTGSHLDLRIYNTYQKRYVNPFQLIS